MKERKTERERDLFSLMSRAAVMDGSSQGLQVTLIHSMRDDTDAKAIMQSNKNVI